LAGGIDMEGIDDDELQAFAGELWDLDDGIFDIEEEEEESVSSEDEDEPSLMHVSHPEAPTVEEVVVPYSVIQTINDVNVFFSSLVRYLFIAMMPCHHCCHAPQLSQRSLL